MVRNCTIRETDFLFESCPLVQFLGENKIEKITDIYKINIKSMEIGELYLSKETNITGKHSPEEKQYFFKQIRKFQENNNDRVQALIAYQKTLEQELKLKNITPRDKVIIWVSRLFGNGIDYVRPLLALLLVFSIASLILVLKGGAFDLSFLFPVFPYVLFDKIDTDLLTQLISPRTIL